MDMSGSADSNKSQSSSSSTAMDVEEPTIVQTQTQTTNARLAIACNCSWPDCPGTLDSPDKCSECREVVHRLCQSNCESRNGWRQLCEEKLYCPTHHPAQIKETNDSISNTSNTSTTVVTRTTRLDPEIGNVLAKPPPSNPSKRSRSSLSDDVKIDNVYQSLDALGSIQSLLQSTLEAQQSVSSDSNEGGLNELTCKSLQLAIDSLKEETAIIASSCANTSAKKQADVAHSKTTKDDRRVAKSKAAMQKKLNACKTPIEKLSLAIKSWSLKKADQDERRAAKSRKSTVVTDASTRTGTSSSSAATAATAATTGASASGEVSARSTSIVVGHYTFPALQTGEVMYSPLQSVNILNSQVDQYIGQAGIEHLANVKKAMIDNNLVPIKISQLNKLLKCHNDGSKPAKLHWNDSGPPEIMAMSDLKAQFLEHQERMGKSWELKDTKDALCKAIVKSYQTRGLDPSSANFPNDRTAQTYHSSLLSDPDIVRRAGRDKDLHREIAETSVRCMLSNLVGILFCAAIIANPNEIPKQFRFVEEGAGQGLLLSRKLVAEAYNVPVDMVHFTPQGLTINTDDMACIYSQLGGLQLQREAGLVLRKNVNGSNNRSYAVHREADEASKKRFDGIKGRYTTTIGDDGSIADIWLQIPGRSAKEMPPEMSPDGVIVVEVDALSLVSVLVVYSVNSQSMFILIIYP